MSNTPRTNAKEKETEHGSDEAHAHYGWKFARQLERELSEVLEDLRQVRVDKERYGAALDRLARLGNEPRYGNSKGNQIALEALRSAE